MSPNAILEVLKDHEQAQHPALIAAVTSYGEALDALGKARGAWVALEGDDDLLQVWLSGGASTGFLVYHFNPSGTPRHVAKATDKALKAWARWINDD